MWHWVLEVILHHRFPRRVYILAFRLIQTKPLSISLWKAGSGSFFNWTLHWWRDRPPGDVLELVKHIPWHRDSESDLLIQPFLFVCQVLHPSIALLLLTLILDPLPPWILLYVQLSHRLERLCRQYFILFSPFIDPFHILFLVLGSIHYMHLV